MMDRKPNWLKCDVCGMVGDFKDKYKPDTLFHKCDGRSSKRIGIWRKHDGDRGCVKKEGLNDEI